MTQWVRSERALHAAFVRGPSAENFSRALRYFRISRNFKGVNGSKALNDALNLYVTGAKRRGKTPEEQVDALATDFKRRFGKYNVSAASKLLWLRHQERFVVLDSRAVRGLKAQTRTRFASRDYSEFAKIWRDYYDSQDGNIRAAANLVTTAASFLPPNELSRSELTEICASRWFHERVLDIFLWEVGGDV